MVKIMAQIHYSKTAIMIQESTLNTSNPADIMGHAQMAASSCSAFYFSLQGIRFKP